MNIISGLAEVLLSIITYGDNKSNYNTGGHPGRYPKVDKRASRKEFKKDQIAAKRSIKLPILELQTILLTYMMNEDDGKINSKEKQIIKDNFKQYKHAVTKDDIKRVRNLLDEPVSLEGIIKYISLRSLNQKTVDRSIGLLDIINQENNIYTDIIETIKRRIQEASDFLI